MAEKTGRDASKASSNMCYQCRKEASKRNEALVSRAGAAEKLGLSESSLADYELGNTKVIPVDKIVLMMDLYKAPELGNWYCKHECPLGINKPLPDEISSVERITLKLLQILEPGKASDMKRSLIEIAQDGEISSAEIPTLNDILEYLDGLIRTATELRIIGHQALERSKDNESR